MYVFWTAAAIHIQHHLKLHFQVSRNSLQQVQQGIPNLQQTQQCFPELFSGQIKYIYFDLFCIYPNVSYQWDMPGTPMEETHEASWRDARTTSTGYFLTKRRSNSSLSSLWICVVATLSLRLSLTTLQRKLILIAWICNIMLLVTPQSSWP